MNEMLVIITVISAVVAARMTVLLLRMRWHERRRSEARVAALAADIQGSAGFDTASDDRHAAVATAEMFATARQTPRRRLLVPAVLGLAAAVAVLLAMGLGNGRTETARPDASTRLGSGTLETLTPQPLELLALDHERQDDSLTVRGVVRNPLHATEVDHLTAVVLLFNRQGGFLTSGRAAVEMPALVAGAETPFAITVPGAAEVGRYRVSFRTDEQLVPHVDRRHGQG